MISFKTYLQEKIIKNWADKIGDDEVILVKELKKHCSQSLSAYKKGSVLYRGDRSYNTKKYVLIDSSKGTRTSRDTNNIYQLMMETSVHLKDIPKRSSSIIVTTTKANAYSYASSTQDLFVVLPFNNVKIAGISQVRDILRWAINSKFNTQKLDLEDLGLGIATVIQHNELERIYKFTDASECDKLLSKLTSYQFETLISEELYIKNDEALKAIRKIKSNKRFTELSNLLMTPDSIKIELKNPDDNFDEGTEYWFSGKAYLISINIIDQVMTIIGEKNDELQKVFK